MKTMVNPSADRLGNNAVRVRARWLPLLGLLALAAGAHSAALVVGYTNALAVANYSQAQMNEIGQLKWYFAHASVGGNMMSGVTGLRSSNSGFYQYQSATEDGTPPAATLTGTIYEHNRGNPGWQAKVDGFQTCASNGWRFPMVNLAVNKFCYIDQEASLDYYLGSMTNLEAAFPETVFVYMTIPLMTSQDSDNYLRNVFNDNLRAWIAASGRVLFDIADIEAHDTNGALCTYTYNSRLCQRLYSGYSSDGGHLNTAGSQLVAKGYYALGAALMAADRDSDGLRDGHELIAGTRPTEARSGLQFLQPTLAVSNTVVLQWPSASNRLYSVQRSTSLAPDSFTAIVSNAPATPPWNTCTDAPPAAGSVFYRLSVKQ